MKGEHIMKIDLKRQSYIEDGIPLPYWLKILTIIFIFISIIITILFFINYFIILFDKPSNGLHHHCAFMILMFINWKMIP